MECSTRSVEYPKFDSVTFTIFERHLEWLNRRFRDTGINRSVSVREALELLIAKYPDDVKYEAPKVILTQDDEGLKQLGADAQCGGQANA